jgi:hypothetical protein
VEVLAELSRAWRNERARLMQSADDIVGRLREMTGADEAAPDRGSVAGREAIDAGVAAFTQVFDRRHGGFGGAPKFPRPSELRFLTDAYALTGRDEAKRMTLETLHAWRSAACTITSAAVPSLLGRRGWRVRTEKDAPRPGAARLRVLDGFQMSGKRSTRRWRNTLAYVVRDLSAPAAFSAEDAGSVPGVTTRTRARRRVLSLDGRGIDRVFDAAAPSCGGILRRGHGQRARGSTGRVHQPEHPVCRAAGRRRGRAISGRRWTRSSACSRGAGALRDSRGSAAAAPR